VVHLDEQNLFEYVCMAQSKAIEASAEQNDLLGPSAYRRVEALLREPVPESEVGTDATELRQASAL
jgi:hypothetical protein